MASEVNEVSGDNVSVTMNGRLDKPQLVPFYKFRMMHHSTRRRILSSTEPTKSNIYIY